MGTGFRWPSSFLCFAGGGSSSCSASPVPSPSTTMRMGGPSAFSGVCATLTGAWKKRDATWDATWSRLQKMKNKYLLHNYFLHRPQDLLFLFGRLLRCSPFVTHSKVRFDHNAGNLQENERYIVQKHDATPNKCYTIPLQLAVRQATSLAVASSTHGRAWSEQAMRYPKRELRHFSPLQFVASFPLVQVKSFGNGNFLGQNQPHFIRNCNVLTLFPWNAMHNVFGRSTWDADLTDVTQSVSLPWHRKWTLHSGSVRYTTEKHTSNAVGVSAPVGSPNISFVSLCSKKNPLNDLLLLSHTYNSLSNAKKTLSVLEILGTASTKKRIGNVALIFNCVAFKNWTSAFKSTSLQHTSER